MMTTIRIITASTLIILLASCASQSPYRAAEGRGYGYTETQLSKDQYRIHFKARGDDTGRAMDYAMLRASEVALEQDYDWFTVSSRDTLVERDDDRDRVQTGVTQGREVTRSCSLLTCRSYERPVSYYDTSMTLGSERSEVEVVLDVHMGKGMRPSQGESFDAREVNDNLSPEEA